MTERERRRSRKGPFKGKGADSREARREAPASQRDAAPAPNRGRAGNPAAGGDYSVITADRPSACCNNPRRPVQGWILVGSIAVRTPNLPLAAQVATRVRPLLAADGHCHVGSLRLRWMRLQQFYRHIGAVP